jgi:hypothetical protein
MTSYQTVTKNHMLSFFSSKQKNPKLSRIVASATSARTRRSQELHGTRRRRKSVTEGAGLFYYLVPLSKGFHQIIVSLHSKQEIQQTNSCISTLPLLSESLMCKESKHPIGVASKASQVELTFAKALLRRLSRCTSEWQWMSCLLLQL